MRLLLVSLFLLFTFFISSTSALPPYRVGILGAGIGGAAAAYHIRKDFADAEITVFEARDYIGGRSKHIFIGGQIVEVGAEGWNSVNPYMEEYASLLNITLSNNTFDGNGEYGLFGNGSWINQKSIIESHPEANGIIDEQLVLFKLHLKTNYIERDDADLKPYATIEEYASYGKLNEYANISTATFVQKENFPPVYYNNVITPMTLEIFDQNLEINNYAGQVSLLPKATKGYSVEGGNSLLVEELFEKANATVYLSSPVQTISKALTGGFSIAFNSTSVHVDAVVIACPIEFINVTFKNIQLPTIIDRQFVDLYITVVIADGLNPTFFGEKSGATIPDHIQTTANTSLPFVELSIQAQAEGGGYIYKTFSNQDIQSYIPSLYINATLVYVQYWPYAYPNLAPTSTYQPIVLEPGLYYQNAIESLASTLESSAIAGRNAAGHVRDYYVTRF